MGEIVFDIETKNTFAEVGSSSPRDLSISVVVIYSFESNEYHVFREEELSGLWPYLDNSTRIIGFNSLHFDLPLLEKYAGRPLGSILHLDMMTHVKSALGHRLKLDDIARATLNVKKSGHGLKAVEWYKRGEWEKIIEYCKDDVKITKEVYEFGLRNKQLFYPDLAGGIKPFPVDFDMPQFVEVEKKTTQHQMSLL